MKLSRRTDYALRAMTYLAVRRANGPCTIAEVSRVEKTPREFTAKVLKDLCRMGFVRSTLGPRGGYRLARPPEMITVLEIMEALDGPVAINKCLADSSYCHQTPGCRMHRLFGRVNEKMREILGGASIADITREEGPFELPKPPPPSDESETRRQTGQAHIPSGIEDCP
jgi:Rrf2 family protein